MPCRLVVSELLKREGDEVADFMRNYIDLRPSPRRSVQSPSHVDRVSGARDTRQYPFGRTFRRQRIARSLLMEDEQKVLNGHLAAASRFGKPGGLPPWYPLKPRFSAPAPCLVHAVL